MKASILWAILVVLLTHYNTTAQPNTEVYLFDLKMENDIWSVNNPINISNNEGYDNQPSFWKDGKSVLYARTINSQTEIARYFINSDKTEILTNTEMGSEYSPTPTPDGKISSIRLDTSGLQLLYVYDLKGRDKVLVDNLVIGYHAWISDTNIVAFVLGEPSSMQIINTVTGDAKTVATSIGRSLHKVPNSKNFSYVDKSKAAWTINEMNSKTLKSTVLTSTLLNSEDYTWTPTNQIIMGSDSKLFLWERNKEWKEIADFFEYGIGKISRLSVSPDGEKIVVVGEATE